MSVTIHHLQHSRSDRLFWLLEELGAPYDVQVHFRSKAGGAEGSLAKASPLGKAPAAVLDGETLIESGCIVSALIRRFGEQAPSGFENPESPTSAFWSTFSEGTLMLSLQPTVVTAKVSAGLQATLKNEGEKRGVDKLKKALFGVAVQNVNSALKYVEEWLSSHENFTGTDKIGAGDIMMHFALAAAYAGGKGPYKFGPKTVQWIQKIQQRPAFKKAMQRRDEEEKKGKASQAKL